MLGTVPNSINSNGEPKTNFLKNNPQLQSVQDILEFMATRCFGRIKMLCPLSKDEFGFDNDAATDFEDDGVTCNICDLKVRNCFLKVISTARLSNNKFELIQNTSLKFLITIQKVRVASHRHSHPAIRKAVQ